MKYNKVSSLIIASIISSSAMAADTITFEGEVTSQTCTVDVNGQTNSYVMLPSVSLSEFGDELANGQTAGSTPFTVSISNCVAPTDAAQNIATRFLGYDVDAASGVMGNRATADAASGFGIQLTTTSDGGEAVVLNGATNVAGLTLDVGATSASHEFGARYYVLDSTSATAGAVTAVAEYTVSYL